MLTRIFLMVIFLLNAMALNSEGAEGRAGLELELRAALKGLGKLTVQALNGGALITGQVDSIQDYNAVKAITRAANHNNTKHFVASTVILSEKAKQDIISAAENEIASPEIFIRIIGDRVIVEGTAQNDYEADRSIEMVLATLSMSRGTRPIASANPTATSAEPGQMGLVVLDLLRVKGPTKQGGGAEPSKAEPSGEKKR